MTDFVEALRIGPELDPSKFVSGARQVTASSNEMSKSVDGMAVSVDKAGKNLGLSDDALHRFAARLDPSIRQMDSFNKLLERQAAFAAAGAKGSDMDAISKAIQLRAVQALGNGLAASGIVLKNEAGAFEEFASKLGGEGTKALEGYAGGLGGMGLVLGGMGPEFLAVAAAAGGFLAVIKDGVEKVSELDVALGRIDAQLRATGDASGQSTEGLDKMAERIASSTLQTRDSVLAAESTLLAFRNVSGDVFERTISLAADMSAVFGTDMASNATKLGRALEDPIEGMNSLRRAGVVLDASQKAVIENFERTGNLAAADGALLDALAAKIGGAAEGSHTGLAGATHDLSEAWDKLLVDFTRSSGIVGGLTKAIDTVSGAMDGFEKAATDHPYFAAFLRWTGNLTPGGFIVNALMPGGAGQGDGISPVTVTPGPGQKYRDDAAETHSDAQATANSLMANAAELAKSPLQRFIDDKLSDFEKAHHISLSGIAPTDQASITAAATALYSQTQANKDLTKSLEEARAAAEKLKTAEAEFAKQRATALADISKRITDSNAKTQQNLYPGSVDARSAYVSEQTANLPSLAIGNINDPVDFHAFSTALGPYLQKMHDAQTSFGQQYDSDQTKGISLTPQGSALMDLQKYSDQMRELDSAYPLAARGTLEYQTKFDGLTESMRKAGLVLSPFAQALENVATSLGDNVTRGLDSMVFDHAKPGQALRSFGQSEAKDLFTNFVDDPLKKSITKSAEGLFGIGKPDGSQFNPLYVTMTGPDGLPLSGPASLSGATDLLSKLVDGGGAPDPVGDPVNSLLKGIWPGANTNANPVGGAMGLFGLITKAVSSFAGIFDEGGTIQPGQWGIKSGMPEIIQGGTAGVSVAPLSAPAYSSGSNNYRGGDNHFYIDARGAQQGVGEEIMAKIEPMMHRVAQAHVVASQQYTISAAVQATKNNIHVRGGKL